MNRECEGCERREAEPGSHLCAACERDREAPEPSLKQANDAVYWALRILVAKCGNTIGGQSYYAREFDEARRALAQREAIHDEEEETDAE